MATEIKPKKVISLHFIYCDVVGFWNEKGDFFDNPWKATAYTDEDLLLIDAEDMKLLTGGKAQIVTFKLQHIDCEKVPIDEFLLKRANHNPSGGIRSLPPC